MADTRLGVPKQHLRSQSEATGIDAAKKTLHKMLRTTSVNCLFNASGQSAAPLSPKGRPRSCTWHGSDLDNDHDDGVFLIEETGNLAASLNAYSEENILDEENNIVSNDQRIEKKAIKDIISDVLVTEFLNCQYDAKVARGQCALVSQRIQASVRNMLDREVKLVATVHTGEQKGQAVEISCQCLWDPEKDNLVTVSFQDKFMFAMCTVFIVHP